MKQILNSSQQESVLTTEGPLLIIAGPGSGKTKTLVERALHLIVDKEVKPENILLSTFTDKAANELITRISERVKETKLKVNLHKMYLGTLHSIFRRIIEENIEYSYFESDFKVIDEVEQTFFIYTHIKEFIKLEGFKDFFYFIQTKNNWEKSKKILFWLNDLNEHSKNLQAIKTNDRSIIFLKEAQLRYKKLLIENNIMDFSTIQQELYRMLVTNPVLLEKVANQLMYIMVDEYQDTNPIQEKLIFLLSSKYENICVVGDDDQSIYRFRGATVENILKFQNKFEKGRCKKIILDINYRSQLDILRVCNNWISLIDWGSSRHFKTIQPPEDKVMYPTSAAIHIGGNGEKEWLENIYKFVKRLKTTGKISDYNQIAFLFRSVQHQRVKNLKKYLVDMGIPVYSPRSKEFFEKEEIMLVIAALLIYFPHSKNLVFNRENNRNDSYNYYTETISLLKKTIEKDAELYQWLVEKRKENIKIEKFPNLRDIVYQLFQFNTFKKFIKTDSQESEQEQLDKIPTHNLAKFTEILERYEYLTKINEITKENIEKYIKYFFMSYLRFLREKRIDEYENKENFPKGAIPFLTFHQSKGLEFPVVVVGSLEKDFNPPIISVEDKIREKLKMGSKNEVLEKREKYDFWRLYYTAFSRAQDLLVLTCSENYNYKKRTPARTFSGLFYSLPSWNDSEKFELQHIDISKVKEVNNKKLLSYTSHILLYEFCPLKYQFIKEFKFKLRKNSSSFYGILFHKILERVHKYILVEKIIPTQEWIEENIKKVRAIVEGILLYKFEDTEVIRALKNIEKYLETVDVESILDSELKLYSIQDNYILEGILDLVKKKDKKFEIIDFKTGNFSEEKMTTYRRQLAIYSYLLSNDYVVDDIQTYLYFPDEQYSYIEGNLKNEEIIKEVQRFDKITSKLLKKEFKARTFDEKCNDCSFKWFCKDRVNKDIEENE